MAASNVPIFPAVINCSLLQFTSSSSAEADLLTAGANGSKVEHVMVFSTDSAIQDAQVFIKIGANDYQIGTVKIPAGAGNTDSVPSVNLLAGSQLPLNYDAQGNRYLYLPASAKLRIAIINAVTSGKIVNFFAQAGDY